MEAPPATILHVDAERGFSGGEVQVFHLMRGLQANGWRQVLIAPPGSQALERIPMGIEGVSVAMRNNMDLGAVLALRRVFKRERAKGPVVAHLHTGRATWLGAWAALGLDVSVVSTRRMDRAVKRGLGTRILYRRLVDHVAAISGPVASGLLDAGVPKERVSVIYSSVDPAQLVCETSAVRDELGIGADEYCLLVLARLDRRKGIDVLLKAMNLVVKEAGLDSLRGRNARARWESREGKLADPNAAPIPSTPVPKLLIAGEGPELEALVALAKELKLDKHVLFLGQRGDKAQLLKACDAAVLPSRFEGLGVAALEAMAAGKPVIASAVGGLGEAVVDGVTGLLVEAEDERGLAGAILKLSSWDGVGERLGRGGVERVREVYSVGGMVAGYEAVYGALRLGRRISVSRGL